MAVAEGRAGKFAGEPAECAEGQGAAAPQVERLGDVLARIRQELEDIAGRIDRNQAAIARSSWAAGSTDAGYVRAMQDADLSAQRIAGIAGFLRALGESAHPQWRIDTAPAARTLTLDGLARALGSAGPGRPEAGDDAATQDGAGEVDLF